MGLLQRLSRHRRNFDFDDGHSVLLVVGIGPDGDKTKLFNDVGWFLQSQWVLMAYTKELYAQETARSLRKRFWPEFAISSIEVPYPKDHPCYFMRQANEQLRGYPGFGLVVVCEQFQAIGGLAPFIDCETQKTPEPEPGDVYQIQVESELCQLVGGIRPRAAA